MLECLSRHISYTIIVFEPVQRAPSNRFCFFVFFFHSAGTNSRNDVHDDEQQRTKKKRLPAWQWFPSLPPLLPNRLWEDPQKNREEKKNPTKDQTIDPHRTLVHSFDAAMSVRLRFAGTEKD